MTLKKSFALIMTVSLLVCTAIASVGPGHSNLKLRQPIKVATLSKSALNSQAQRKMSLAVASAEKIDQRIPHYLQASSLGAFQRWKSGVDLQKLESEYNQDLLTHISAMTEILRIRRGQRGFKKWQEFEFNNLMAKSDYILAVPMSRQSLNARKGSLEIQRTLEEYNRERLFFDGQKISL